MNTYLKKTKSLKKILSDTLANCPKLCLFFWGSSWGNLAPPSGQTSIQPRSVFYCLTSRWRCSPRLLNEAVLSARIFLCIGLLSRQACITLLSQQHNMNKQIADDYCLDPSTRMCVCTYVCIAQGAWRYVVIIITILHNKTAVRGKNVLLMSYFSLELGSLMDHT